MAWRLRHSGRTFSASLKDMSSAFASGRHSQLDETANMHIGNHGFVCAPRRGPRCGFNQERGAQWGAPSWSRCSG
eukprot:5272336-Pyramimonas_sp.AAC.1